MSIPYEHEMNGKAENNNRIVLESTRAALQGSSLPNSYWSYAATNVVYVYNRLKQAKTGKSPWELIYGAPPSLDHLRIFGIDGFSHISKENRTKLDPTAVPAKYLGVAPDSVGYILQDLKSKRIFYSRTFYCNEEAWVNRARPSIYLDETGEYIEETELNIASRTLEEV